MNANPMHKSIYIDLPESALYENTGPKTGDLVASEGSQGTGSIYMVISSRKVERKDTSKRGSDGGVAAGFTRFHLVVTTIGKGKEVLHEYLGHSGATGKIWTLRWYSRDSAKPADQGIPAHA